MQLRGVDILIGWALEKSFPVKYIILVATSRGVLEHL